MSKKVETISQAVFWGFWLRVTKWVATLLASVLIVRMLGKEQYGLLSVVRVFVSYVMILYTLNLDQALLRYLPELRTLGAKGETIRFLGKIFCFQVLLWLLFLGLILFFLEPISHFLGKGVQTYLWVALALSLFSFLQLDLSNALMTFYKVKTQVIGGAAAALVFLALLYGLLQSGWRIWGVLFSEALVALGVSLWFLKTFFRLSHGADGESKKKSPIPLSRVLKFSIPFVCLTLVNQIIWRQSELFFLAYYETPGVVGLYNVGFSLPQLLLEFAPSFLGAVGAVGAVDQFMRGIDHLSKGITWYYKILFFLLAPLVTGGALFSDRLIYFLYGPEFALSGLIAQIYFALFVFVFLLTPYGLANIAEERIWISVALSVPVCILNLILDFVWIKRFGIWGAVGAVGVSNLVAFFVTFFMWKKVFPYVVIPWRFIGKCFLATVPFFIFFPMKALSDHLLWFVFLCLSMAGLYLWAVRRIKLFGPEEIELLGQSRIPGSEKMLKFLR